MKYNKTSDIQNTHEAVETSQNINPVLLAQLKNHFNNAVILDVETTGLATGNEDLEKNKELTNISILDAETGKDLFTTFVKPKHPISDQLAIVNIINNDIVKDAPDFSEIYADIVKYTKGKKIIGWNIQFDVNTIIEEAKKLNRDYLTDSDIEGIEDGMELAMKASGLFKYTYNTAMFWKQDEACKLFDSYIYNANEIEKFANYNGNEDHIKDLENYIDTQFDEKYRKELHDQLGTKEMHLAYCDNKEYRLTMMKVTEMYRRGITADKDKFINSLMTSKKKVKYKTSLEKEQKVEEIINYIKNGYEIDDMRKRFAEEIGGNRAFDSILLSNKSAFNDMENSPFDISPFAKKAIEKKFKELGNVFDVAKRTGYSILTVRNNVPKNGFTYSDKKELESFNNLAVAEGFLDADKEKRENIVNGKINNSEYKNDTNKTAINSNLSSGFNKNNQVEKSKEAKRKKIEAQLGKNNSPLSSEIVENLSQDEQNTLNQYLAAKKEEKYLSQKYKAYEAVINERLTLSGISEKVVFQDSPELKIAFDPEKKVKKTFDRDAFEKECPDIAHKYLMKEITKDNLEKIEKKYPDIYNKYVINVNDVDVFDYDEFKINEPDLYNIYATPFMSSSRKTMRFTAFGEEPSFEDVENKIVDYGFFNEMLHIAKDMEEAKKTASQFEKDVKNIIISHDCMRIDGNLGRVSYSESTPKQKFNSALLKEEEPDLYDYYSKVDISKNTIKTSTYMKRMDKNAVAMDLLFNEIAPVEASLLDGKQLDYEK